MNGSFEAYNTLENLYNSNEMQPFILHLRGNKMVWCRNVEQIMGTGDTARVIVIDKAKEKRFFWISEVEKVEIPSV